ncbi:MAG: ABC transporter permease [Pseudomonadota bacterium]
MELKLIDVDKWQEIFSTLKKQKLRTSLTAFGVFWGIFMLVILLGFGTGYGIKVDALFGDRKNVIFLWSTNPTQLPYKGLGKGRSIVLTQGDIDAVKQKISGIKLIDGQNFLRGAQFITHEKSSGSFNVLGSHAGWESLQTNRVVSGRYVNQLDEDEFRKVAIIGTRVRDILFKGGIDPIGKAINIRGVHFQVVGVYVTTEPDDGNRNQSNSVFIPNNSLRKAFNQMDRLGDIWIQPIPGYKAEQIEKDAKKLIYERQKIHPDDVGVLRTYNVEQEFRQQQNLVKGILGFSWLVAIGTIIAGVIGVGNIMLVVVKERTREIGLRKALGATPAKISLMIVQESLLITIVSGYTGLVAGVYLLEGIKSFLVKIDKGSSMFASPYINISTALIGLLVLVMAGVVASLLPAMKAASVNPILALQDE